MKNRNQKVHPKMKIWKKQKMGKIQKKLRKAPQNIELKK